MSEVPLNCRIPGRCVNRWVGIGAARFGAEVDGGPEGREGHAVVGPSPVLIHLSHEGL